MNQSATSSLSDASVARLLGAKMRQAAGQLHHTRGSELHSLFKCGIVNIMNDSLDDFASPKRLKIRRPLGELQVHEVNNCANSKNTQELEYKWKTVSNVPKSINVTKKDAGVQCVVDVKTQGTQLGRENSVSYGKGNDHPPITYRYLLSNIIASKDSAMEYCFATGLLTTIMSNMWEKYDTNKRFESLGQTPLVL